MKHYILERIYLFLIKIKIRKVLRKSIKYNYTKFLEHYKKKEIFDNIAYQTIQELSFKEIPMNNEYLINHIRPLIEKEITKISRKYF